MHRFVFLVLLKNVRSVNVRNKNSERRRRESTKSASVSLKSKKGSSVPVSRRSRSGNAAVKRREGARQRRNPRFVLFFLLRHLEFNTNIKHSEYAVS